jgi:hypothetical protein
MPPSGSLFALLSAASLATWTGRASSCRFNQKWMASWRVFKGPDSVSTTPMPGGFQSHAIQASQEVSRSHGWLAQAGPAQPLAAGRK